MPKKKNSPDYGKGDWKRPVDEKKFSANWDRIFGNKDTKREVNTDETGTSKSSSE